MNKRKKKKLKKKGERAMGFTVKKRKEKKREVKSDKEGRKKEFDF